MTVGMYVPGPADLLAANVSNPDGFVSLAAYISEMPPGNPVKFTNAVSLVESMIICACAGGPPGATTTVGELSETVIGCRGPNPPPPPPPPRAGPATTTRMI